MNEQRIIEMNKYFYDLFCSVNWDTSKVANLISDKDNIDMMRQAAKRYALNNLGMSEEEYYSSIEDVIVSKHPKYKKSEIGLLERISDATTSKELDVIASHYCDSKLLTSSTYKRKMENYVENFRPEENIESGLLGKILTIRKLRKESEVKKKYFEEHADTAVLLVTSFVDSDYKDVESFCECSNISIMDFYTNVVITKYIDEQIYHDFKKKENLPVNENINATSDKGLHAYTIWSDVNWNSDEFAHIMGFDSVNSARKAALKYANSIGISSSEFYLEKHLSDGQLHKDIKYSVLHEELSDCDYNLDDIYNVVTKYFDSGMELKLLTRIYVSIPYYVRKYRSTQEGVLESDLERKFNLVRDYFREEKYDNIRSIAKKEKHDRDLNDLDSAIEVLKKYVTHTSTKADFRKENDLTIHELAKSFKLVKELKPDLYEELKKEKHNYIEDVFSDHLNKASVMLELMDDGMLNKNGTIRDFDLLDYYGLVDMGVRQFFDIVKHKLELDEISKFSGLLATEQHDFKVKPADILAMKHQFLVKDGIREITKEEKKAIIDYLSNNNVALTNEVYQIAIKRLISDNLDLDTPLEESVLSNLHKGNVRKK